MSNDTERKNNEIINSNFIYKIIDKDMEDGVYGGRVQTRFPPEPNGYLHIGSAYAINVSYSAAERYRGKFNLRFDDTNPCKEDIEYVDSIIEDMQWMGFDWENRLFFGSDYFEKIHEYAVKLIKKGKAYVCDLSPSEVRACRGTLTEPGKNSPYRDRTVEENLDLFERMKNGEFPAGARVLRAKIDMASPNMNMRDPVMYRIQYAKHYRRGDTWCIYPMYDYAHPLQDAIEGVTHSLCSMEFKDHRPLYEWFLKELEIETPPKQREFGRMNLKGVVTSKRYLRDLVFGNYVDGWDDPRLPTLRGLRRRGFTPESIKSFLNEIGVSKGDGAVDFSMLEYCLRRELKSRVSCVMAVLKPLKVTIINYPEGQTEMIEVENNPENPELGSRMLPFSKTLFIEKKDFMENPVKGFHRLSPGMEVRLKGAYYIKCEKVIKDKTTGEVIELHCTYDPETKSGSGHSGRKVKGTIHWVSVEGAVKAEVRLYDSLLRDDKEVNDSEKDWEEKINPESLIVLKGCMLEPFLKKSKAEDKYQFIRHGYFCVDMKHSTDEKLIFNRIVPLKDSWKKEQK
jgi:glutaminyl-tRNA synthetase